MRSYDLPPALLRDWVAAGATGRAVVRAQVGGEDTDALAYVALDRSGAVCGRAFPVLLLRSGRVRVSGRPAGARQPAAGVLTGHALVNSRRREAVDLVVVRALRRTVARVTTGRTVVVTPSGASAGTPCPPGQARAVGPGGVVRAL